MHESVMRLLNLARDATSGSAHPVHSLADLGQRLQATPQTRNNWRLRGVSKSAALEAERIFGCSARYVLSGEGPHWTESHRPTGGLHTDSVAQELSHPQYKVVPKYIAWECLMDSQLEREFQTTVPDSAMAPDVPKGATIICVTGIAPEPGDFVLVADSTGIIGLREYRLLRPGVWEAHARHPSFLPLRSDAHGLTIIAVFDGMRGRRSAR